MKAFGWMVTVAMLVAATLVGVGSAAASAQISDGVCWLEKVGTIEDLGYGFNARRSAGAVPPWDGTDRHYVETGSNPISVIDETGDLLHMITLPGDDPTVARVRAVDGQDRVLVFDSQGTHGGLFDADGEQFGASLEAPGGYVTLPWLDTFGSAPPQESWFFGDALAVLYVRDNYPANTYATWLHIYDLSGALLNDVWSFNMGGVRAQQLAVAGDQLVVLFEDGTLRVYADTGVQVGDDIPPFESVGSGRRLEAVPSFAYVAYDNFGSISIIDLVSGERRRTIDNAGSAGNLMVADDHIVYPVFPPGDSAEPTYYVAALDGSGATELSSTDGGSPLSVDGYLWEDVVYDWDSSKKVDVFDPTGGVLGTAVGTFTWDSSLPVPAHPYGTSLTTRDLFLYGYPYGDVYLHDSLGSNVGRIAYALMGLIGEPAPGPPSEQVWPWVGAIQVGSYVWILDLTLSGPTINYYRAIVFSTTSCGPPPPVNTFIDDDGSVFEGDIEWLAGEGITKGCNPPINDMFCPGDPVTRGQMAAFLVRALGYSDDGGGNLFVDDDDSIFEADIDKLGTAGVTKGCNPPLNDTFCPTGLVTRGQMAAFLVRALGLTDDGGGNLFVDDDDSIFEADIDKLGTAGVTKGCNPPLNDQFCPNDPVTRAQMAAFLHRALGP